MLEINEDVAFLRELERLFCQLGALFCGVALLTQPEIREIGGLDVGRFQFFALGLAESGVCRAQSVESFSAEPGVMPEFECDAGVVRELHEKILEPRQIATQEGGQLK